MTCQEVVLGFRSWLCEKTACTFGAEHAIGGRAIAEVRADLGFGEAVADGRGDEVAVNVGSFSAGVRPLRAMEKRS